MVVMITMVVMIMMMVVVVVMMVVVVVVIVVMVVDWFFDHNIWSNNDQTFVSYFLVNSSLLDFICFSYTWN